MRPFRRCRTVAVVVVAIDGAACDVRHHHREGSDIRLTGAVLLLQ